MKYNADIVIIDSGFSQNERSVDGSINGVTIADRGKGSCVIPGYEDSINHGTGIVGVILQHVRKVSLYIVKLEDVSVEGVIFALRHVYEQVECKFINLSFGLSYVDNYDRIRELHSICDMLAKKGVILVAAYDNDGGIVYPAAFESVIGVTTGYNCHRSDEVEGLTGKIINLRAKGDNQPVWSSVGQEKIVRSGDSYACAHVTGMLMSKYIPDKRREEYLKDFGCVLTEDNTRSKLAEAEEVKNKLRGKKSGILFWGKEMHTMVRFPDQMISELVAVYDLPQLGKVGSNAYSIVEASQEELIIQNWSDMDCASFEVLFVGHIMEEYTKERILNKLKRIIDECIEKDVFIYSFDELSDYIDVDRKDYFCPNRITMLNPYDNEGKLYPISTPVVGVFGTSSSQGKFSVQLTILRELRKMGLSVGMLGTEPTALEFGADCVFPFGYKSSIGENGYSTIVTLNHILNEIDEAGRDIILTGCQSMTIPDKTSNIKSFTVKQMNFLLGVMPDKVVLCANLTDEIEYVKRTVAFIESATSSKVACIIASPVNRKLEDLEKTGKVRRYIYQCDSVGRIPVLDFLKEDWCNIALRRIGINM